MLFIVLFILLEGTLHSPRSVAEVWVRFSGQQCSNGVWIFIFHHLLGFTLLPFLIVKSLGKENAVKITENPGRFRRIEVS